MIHKYGLIRQFPDIRDVEYQYMPSANIVIPPTIDYRSLFPPSPNQLDLGCCTAESAVAALYYDERKQNEQVGIGSPLFFYYNERSNKGQDTGATIRQSVKTAVKYGTCDEALWPYDTTKFAEQPSQECYDQAAKRRARVYRPVAQNLMTMQTCLASGYPIMIGFTVYSSFESDVVASTGIVPMPGNNESVLGGHAVLIVGYENDKQWFIVRNSWGTDWGDNGCCYMPYSFVLSPHIATDFWMIQTVA